MSVDTPRGPTYSRLSGFVFLFNLILGTGALALPKAFKDAGWLVTTFLLALIAAMSFISVTFMIEAMAICNALKLSKGRVEPETDSSDDNGQLVESTEISEEDFEIVRKYEYGEISRGVAGNIWTILCYLNMVLYLYGDLSVYAVAVSKSLRDVTCNSTGESLEETDPCWSSAGLSRMNIYRIYVSIFALVLGPFFFCNVTKTRVLQIGTTCARWLAIIVMSSIAIARIVEFPEIPRLSHATLPGYIRFFGTPDRPNPPMANWASLPSAFGICVYAFMCHHSLPGVVTPIEDKSHFFSSLLLPAFIVIYAIYLLLAGTAVAAFDYIHDLYTLNFVPSADPAQRPRWLLLIVEYFIALYPVFALSSNFPVMGTTLSNNLVALFLPLVRTSPRGRNVVRWGVPLLALLPPILIAMLINDVEQLTGIIGAFGGSGIMYIFPVVFVFYARRAVSKAMKRQRNPSTSEMLNDESLRVTASEAAQSTVKNRYESPFRHTGWLCLTVVWAISCALIVLVHKFGGF